MTHYTLYLNGSAYDVLQRRIAALETAVAELSKKTSVQDGDRLARLSAHDRPVRAGDAGMEWRLDQSTSLGPWECFVVRKLSGGKTVPPVG